MTVVASSEEPIQSVFVSFPRCPSVTMVSGHFSIIVFGRLCSSIVETCLAQRSCLCDIDAVGNHSLFKDLDVGGCFVLQEGSAKGNAR